MKPLNHWWILHYIKKARRLRSQESRDEAWLKALTLARDTKGWMNVDCGGKRLGGPHPIEITRTTKTGTVYGRKHQRNGKIGAERAWGRTA